MKKQQKRLWAFYLSVNSCRGLEKTVEYYSDVGRAFYYQGML